MSLSARPNKLLSSQQTKASIMTLISLERAQKLDLLIHLIGNLTQSLVLCGPEGIGKTTLLQALESSKKDVWTICWLKGASSLSFESIQETMLQDLIKLEPVLASMSLADVMNHFAQKSGKIVLIVDDAGLLVPGLISALIRYANSNSTLRLVLALTHDELHVKNSTDKEIDDCHFIEIPPLTEKQCMTFLQNLSGQKRAAITYNAISEKLVENLYRETHGIPGKIVNELPNLSQYQARPGSYLGLIGLVSVLVALGAVYFFRNQTKSTDVDFVAETPSPVVVEKPLRRIEINVPVLSGSDGDEADNSASAFSVAPDDAGQPLSGREPQLIREYQEKPVAEETTDSDLGTTALAEPPQIEVVEETPVHDESIQQAVTEPMKPSPAPVATAAPAEDKPTSVKITAEDAEKPSEETSNRPPDTQEPATVEAEPQSPPPPAIVAAKPETDAVWLDKQVGTHYTLQLMVLSSAQAVKRLQSQHPSLRSQLKALKRSEDGKYVVVYGSYPSKALALQAKKSMPKEFRKAWIRPFKDLR